MIVLTLLPHIRANKKISVPQAWTRWKYFLCGLPQSRDYACLRHF
ncbi:hypothetical protein EV06_1901 [Prochlorococcus sp. MIT 0602]|nr:hypothetical protein EV06_1901 [Prochlorococcus sp. MIT 0602]